MTAVEPRPVTALEVVSLILEIPGRDDLCSDFVVMPSGVGVAWWMPGDRSRRVQVTGTPDWTTVSEHARDGTAAGDLSILVNPAVPGCDLLSLVRGSIGWLTGDRADYRPRTTAKTPQDAPGRTDGGPDDCGHGETGGGL